MTEDERLLIERMRQLEQRLAALERREYTSGGGVGDMTKAVYDTDGDGRVNLAVDADTIDGSHANAFAPEAKGVTNGDSHDHQGGDGAQIDHGNLGGLGDDDHTQYYNQARGDARYALAGKGVTNGDSHDHDGGDGAQIDHGNLGGLGDDDHTQYYNQARGDARYALAGKGVTNGDSHDHQGGDGAQIDHGNLGGLGDDDHTQYLLANGNRKLSANLTFTNPGSGYNTRDIKFDGAAGGMRFSPTNSFAVQPDGAAIQFWNNTSSLPGQLYLDSGAHASAALIFRTAPASTDITERWRINAYGHLIPGANKSYNIGAADRRVNAIYSSASLSTGTSRTFKSKKICPVCTTQMIRGTGSVCILGEDRDYEVAMCPSCGCLAADEVSHLPAKRLAERRQPDKIEFLGFNVFEVSGNSLKVEVNFRYKNSRSHEEAEIVNSTFLGEEEIIEFRSMNLQQRANFLKELGMREWNALEETRLIRVEVEQLQSLFDGLADKLVGQDLLAPNERES